MDTSKPQKNIINKPTLGNVASVNLKPQCNDITGIFPSTNIPNKTQDN